MNRFTPGPDFRARDQPTSGSPVTRSPIGTTSRSPGPLLSEAREAERVVLEDRTTIAFAELIEREFGGFTSPPLRVCYLESKSSGLCKKDSKVCNRRDSYSPMLAWDRRGHPSRKFDLTPARLDNRSSRAAHSITSSAVARSNGATVMPSARAVFRLITSSNLFEGAGAEDFWT